MADNSLPPVPTRRAPLIDIMRELEARPRSRRSQEFDPVAALAAERRSQSRQPLPLPPTPPAASPPPQPGETQAGAGTPPPAPDLSGVYPDIRRRLPENNPYVAAAIRIAEKYDLPPSVFLSLVQRESNFNPRAVSPRGAVGLGQLMPGTAQELGVDPRDPEANLDASARYLKQQITRFGSIPIALAAYNAGPGRVAKSGNQVPNIRETQEYVSDIMRNAGMEGYEGDQRYGFAEGGLAALDEKYAEGGRVGRVAGAVRRAVTRRAEEPSKIYPRAETVPSFKIEPEPGQPFESWLDSLYFPEVRGADNIIRHPSLMYRGVSDAELEAAIKNRAFRPLSDPALFIENDPTRYIGGGAYGAKNAGAIIQFDVGGLPSAKQSGRVRDLIEDAVPEIPTERVTRIWRWDPERRGHYLMSTDEMNDFLRRNTTDLESLSEKYADGGRVRSPAAAPVASPFDADYIERLAARAVGAGEPERDPRDVTLLDRVGRGIGEAYREFVETPERLAQQVYDDAIERGVDPESAARRADRIARRAALTTGAVEMAVPQTPADLALVAAGPLGRVAPAAGRVAAGAAGVMMAMEPSEAEAGALRRFIRAYHGSPHRFENFDINKVGTGEGAQAYGRGFYFAENENVAKSYRDKLAPLGPSAGRGFGPKAIAARLLDSGASVDEAIAELNNRIRMPHIQRGLAQRNPDIMNYTSDIAEAKALLQNPSSRGHMYEVNINANPREFLNWDLPLSQQSRDVQEALSRFGLRADSAAMRAYDDALLDALHNDPSRALPRMPRDPTGEEIYQRALKMTPEEARVALMQAGIPGTRYLDAGSRGVGGSYNYAVFDPEIIDIVRRYAKGGLAALDEKYAEGGTVRAPKETYISGQEHKLAYITDREAALLKARGGSGRMTDYGVRAYDADPGGDAQGSDPGPTDAGPTDAGPSTDPGPTTDSPGPRGGMSNEDPEGTPAAANMNTAVDAAREGRGVGIADTAGVSPTGFNAAPGIAEAIGAYSRGEISLAEAIGYGLQSGLAPPGVTPGISVDELGVQTPAISVDPLGLGLGLVGMAVGVPGLGALGGRVGSAVSQALGVAPSVFSSNPNEGPAAPSDMGGGEYLQYGQTQYGLPTQTNVASSTAPTSAAPLVDWNQIQREANALNMSVSDYLALKWRSPAAMARGGEVSLEEMGAKYAEGGGVHLPPGIFDIKTLQGEIAEFDPDEIDRIARQIHLRFPEEDLIRPGSEDVESPSDLTMRARLMMRGQNVGLPETVGRSGGNDRFTSSTSMRDIPIESEPYGTSQRMLNTSINAVLDVERDARIGAGMLALERSGERGFTGYGPKLSANYGPASIYGGYQAITRNMPGAKSQGSYVYGGNLNIPIDESGTEANIGGTVMSGRRGQGGGPSGTQIMGSLERPLLGGRLALELAADPSLRHKEILLGYRRAF